MKKSFLLLALSLGMMGAAQAQDARGHFSMRYSGGVAETNLEAFCRTQLPKLCDGSTFQVTRDNVDQQGYRHVTMQQYVHGIRANGMTLNVHVCDGKITSINGNVLTQDMVPHETVKRTPRPADQVLKTAGLSENQAEKAELVLVKKDGTSHVCYRVLDGFMCKHIDAFSGEVLSESSILKHAAAADEEPEMVKGQGQTMFLGIQDIDVSKMDGKYFLSDTQRGIYTLNASMELLTANGFDEDSDDSFELIRSSEPFINDSPDWLDPTFKAYVKDIEIAIDSPDYLGSYVYVSMILSNYETIETDTVLIEDESTWLHLPYVIDQDEAQIVFASAYLLDPESGETESIDEFCYVGPGCNAQGVPLKDDCVMIVHNYFEGYVPAIDVHWGISKVWDYYHDEFGLNSFDGKGTDVCCLINTPQYIGAAENAFAVGELPEDCPGIMLYGLGGSSMYPVVDFTVTGHEFTHLVAQKLAVEEKDDEEHQPNALNESFADIMAISIYRHVFGKEIWAIGSTVMRHGYPMRRLDSPESAVDPYGEPDPEPSCYMDENFDDEDYEEHTNAGVQNHMFYLLVTGGEGVNSLGENYAVTPMDRTEAEHLAFLTLTEYVDNGMTYEDVPEAWINAAIQLFGENSAQLKSVCQAWTAVGLPQDDITTIEQIRRDSQKRGLRYNLQGQRVGDDYTGFVIEI